MPLVDLPLSELKKYHPPLSREKNFEQFWKENVKQANEQPLNVKWTDMESFSERLKISRATIDGFSDKSKIVGLYVRNANEKEKRPALLQLHGYARHRAHVTDYLGWVALGFSVFAVDVRGQAGESVDSNTYPSGTALGHLTKGILDEKSYFYRYVYMDCYRSVKCLLEREDVDETNVGVMGASQGGGLSIATAALNEKIKMMISSVPFLCNFKRAVEIAPEGPYLEILDYLREHPDQEEDVYRTLSYFDAMNLAPLIKAPTLTSVGLLDTLCPPSTIFATHYRIGSRDKELAVYPGVGHEDSSVHVGRKMGWAVKQVHS